MHYDHETLVNMSSTTYYDLDLSRLGPRVKSSVIKALHTGMMTADSGAAATTYNILCDAFSLPLMAFSIRKGFYVMTKHIPAAATPLLKEWWNVDRVSFRMEKPEEWAKYQKNHYFRKFTIMPSWIENEHSSTGTDFLRILTSGISRTVIASNFLKIAQTYCNEPEYKNKVAPIIEQIAASSIIKIQAANKTIKGV